MDVVPPPKNQIPPLPQYGNLGRSAGVIFSYASFTVRHIFRVLDFADTYTGVQNFYFVRHRFLSANLSDEAPMLYC